MSQKTVNHQPKILLVDDHKIIRTSIRDWLGSIFPHCDFMETGYGEEAVELTQDHSPDVIIMDISLPGIDGIEATKRIKKFLPEVFIIMITIYDSNLYEVKSLEAGASAFISKRKMSRDLINILTEYFENNFTEYCSYSKKDSKIETMNAPIGEEERMYP